MPNLLESLEWGKSALQFLESFKFIDEEKPVTVYLRHSKADYANVESPKNGVLTEQGRQTSKEFGLKLPSRFIYRIYHSTYPRAKITAQQIHRGLIMQNAESQVMGVQQGLIFLNKHEPSVKKFFDIYGSDFVTHWLSGRFSEKELQPSIDFAKDSARKIVSNLREAEPKTINLYVNHDVTIVPMMFHWFGVYKKHRWTGYLDGFILQLYEDYMFYADKEGEHRTHYPHWWRFRN